MFALLRIPTLRWTILSQTALFFVLGSNAYWLPTVLVRRFGMSVEEAGALSGTLVVLGGLVGSLVAGWAADWRRRSSPQADLEVAIVSFFVAAVCVPLLLVGPRAWIVPALFFAVASLFAYAGPFAPITTNVVQPSLRGSAVTVTLLVTHFLGIHLPRRSLDCSQTRWAICSWRC